MPDPTAGLRIPPDAPGPRILPGHPTALDWILVVWLSALSGAIAFVGLFFLPWYRGSTPLPVAALVVVPVLTALPRMSYRLTGGMPAALAPVLAWLVVTVGLFLADNPLYNATSRSGPSGVPVTWQGWQFLLWVGLGGLVAAVSVGLLWGDHLRLDILARRGSNPPGDDQGERSGTPAQVRAPFQTGDTDR